MKLPPLSSLLAFEAAARHENFATAAEEMNLSQSAVSHRVRNLEHYLGYQLFERLPRGIRLTEHGKAYVPSVRHAFEEIMSATTGIFGTSERASLNIRAPISYAALWLAKFVASFKVEYPNIGINLFSTIWAEKTVSEVDLEFRLGGGSWSGYEADLLFVDELVPVCRPEVAKRINMTKNADQLSSSALIYLMGGEDYWAKFFARQGMERYRKLSDISVDSALAAIELAAGSDQIAIIQESLTRDALANKKLALASCHKVTPDEGFYLLRPKTDQQRKPEAVIFENWLRQQI